MENRRNFLKLFGLGAVGVVSPKAPKETIKVVEVPVAPRMTTEQFMQFANHALQEFHLGLLEDNERMIQRDRYERVLHSEVTTNHEEDTRGGAYKIGEPLDA